METLVLTKKKNTKSAVWTFFSVEHLPDGSSERDQGAVCNLCLRKINAKGGNTSNLFQHLRSNHPQEYDQIKDKKLVNNVPARLVANYKDEISTKKAKPVVQMPNVIFVSNGDPKASVPELATQKHEKGSEQWQTLTDAITFFLSKEKLPATYVERTGFIQMLQAFDSRYAIPSADHFKNVAIAEVYEGVCETVLQELAGMIYCSATCSIQMSGDGNTYLIVSVHFIDAEWEFKSRCLGAVYLPDHCTSSDLAEVLTSVLRSWDIPESKLVAVTFPQNQRLSEMIHLMEKTGLPCLGERIQKSIQRTFEGEPLVKSVLQQCQDLIRMIVQNKQRMQLLFGFPEAKGGTLICDSTDRWQTIRDMVENILSLETSLCQITPDAYRPNEKIVSQLPLWDNKTVLTGIKESLDPLIELTETLATENFVMLSTVRPVLHLLSSTLLTRDIIDDETTQLLKERILNFLKLDYEEIPIQDMMNQATMLDPRFKTMFFTPTEEERVIKLIVSGGVTEVSKGDKEDMNVLVTPQVTHEDSPLAAKKRKSLGKLLGEIKPITKLSSNTTPDKIKKELDTYISSMKIDSEANPLQWWCVHEKSYPTLAKLAKRYLCMCATSSPSEFLFSNEMMQPLSGDPVEINRSVFLSHNLSGLPSRLTPTTGSE